MSGPKHYVHTCVDHCNNIITKELRLPESYHSRALTLGFLSALGQARLIYGKDVKGELSQPVTVHFVSTDGCNFHFSVFQLNTLDLEEPGGKKNIFWHEEDMTRLYDVCEYVSARPTLKGFNPEIFAKFFAMYSQNAE